MASRLLFRLKIRIITDSPAPLQGTQADLFATNSIAVCAHAESAGKRKGSYLAQQKTFSFAGASGQLDRAVPSEFPSVP